MIRPFESELEFEEPLIDLDQVKTVSELLELAKRHPQVVVRQTRGVARHRNQCYVRFAIFDVVTRLNGRLYLEVETTGPTPKNPDATVENWRSGKRSNAQEYADLLELHRQARKQDPDSANRTDDLCARLFEEHAKVFAPNYRAERTWLTMFEFLSGHSLRVVSHLRNPRPNIFIHATSVQQALAKTFGIQRWSDLRYTDP